MKVNTDEVFGARDVARGFSELVDRLLEKDLEKVVVLRRGYPVAVIVTFDRFDEMDKELP